MRITKIGGYSHYKNKVKGELRDKDSNKVEINNITSNLVIKKEISKILRKYKSKSNKEDKKDEEKIKARNNIIFELIENSVEDKELDDTIKKIKILYKDDKYTGKKQTVERKEVIEYALNKSDYKNDIINFIDNIVVDQKNLENHKEIFNKKVINPLKEKIRTRKKFLEKSLENNHLCKIENGEFKYSSPKANFIKELYNEDYNWLIVNQLIDIKKFKDLEKRLDKKFEFEDLEKNFKYEDLDKKFNFNNSKSNQYKFINATREHIKSLGNEKINFWKENSELSIYCNEVKRYVEREETRKKNKTIDIDKMKETIRYQFENLIRNQLIQEGKLIHYFYINQSKWDQTEFETSDLERIKVIETFDRKLIDMITFARNFYISTVHGKEFDKDLTQRNLESYLKECENDKLIEKIKLLGLNIDNLNLNKDESIKVLIDIFNSFYILRNNSYHFQDMKKDKALQNDSAVEHFIKYDIIYAKNHLLRKFYSNEVYKYFSEDELESYFKNITFDIKENNIPFAPSFNNVVSLTNNVISTANKNKLDSLEDMYNIKRSNENSNKLLAKKYMLYNIYKYEFINDFTDVKKKYFKEAIDEFKKYTDSNSKGNYMKGYKNLLETVKFKDKIVEYMSTIQKLQVDDNNKKEENKPHYKKFIQYIFRIGFTKYLNDKNISLKIDKKIEEIQMSEQEFFGKYKNNINIKMDGIDLSKLDDIHNEINLSELDKIHKYFYYFLKMLDNKQINILNNEFTKLDQVRNKKESINHPIFSNSSNNIEIYKTLIGLVKLGNDSFGNNPEEDYIVNKLENFLDTDNPIEFVNGVNKLCEDKQRDSLYIQSDGKTPIRFHMIDKVYRNGLQNLFINLVNKNEKLLKISEKDIEEFLNKEKEIPKKVKEKEKLHEQYENSLIKKQKFTYKNKTDYEELVKEIKRYDYLKQKVTLGNIYRLQHLVTDIFGRLIGYMSIWERDYYFMTLSHLYNNNLLNDNIGTIKEKMKIGEIKKVTNIINNSIISSKGIRDGIAHLDYFRKQDKSIIDYINDTRKLMSYDRKLKNSVSKSIKDILKEEWKIDITFDIINSEDNGQHDLKFNSIKSEKEFHLKKIGKGLEIDHNTEEFVEIVEELLKFKTI